jgi:hypothetical protein
MATLATGSLSIVLGLRIARDEMKYEKNVFNISSLMAAVLFFHILSVARTSASAQ